MKRYDLRENATLYDCVDPNDEEMCGQAVTQGSLADLVKEANTWADVRLSGARIVTAGAVEYRKPDIERIHWAEFSET